jgi:hypothetical protein
MMVHVRHLLGALIFGAALLLIATISLGNWGAIGN